MAPRRRRSRPALLALALCALGVLALCYPAAAAAGPPAACDPTTTDCCNCCDPTLATTKGCTAAACAAAKKPYNPCHDERGPNPGCIEADHSVGTNQTFAWSCAMLGLALFLTIASMCGIDYTNDTLLFARFTATGGAGAKRD